MIEPAVREKLDKYLKELSTQGKLLSRVQLDQYYSTFRSRFGPDRLAGLDGEPLLEEMHAHGTKDSLVYWLEFKDDEEFPARFGSIAGGNALKFGIFKRKETGAWTVAGEGNYPKEMIPLAEAIAVARKHRDQLVRGVELLRQLPAGGSDEDYSQLQALMDRDAQDVSDLAWGHKYFSLVCPDKLDFYHMPDWQRFQLLKLLQLPPDREGRYACAGRFVAAAVELGEPMQRLCEVLSAANGWRHRYWRIGTSDGNAPRNRWPLMRDGGFAAIGWSKVGDLSELEVSTEFSATTTTKESRDRLKKLITENYPNTAAAVGRAATQMINFARVIATGDYVLACDGGTVLGIGRVTGEYTFEAASEFAHRRPVEWISRDEWEMPEPEGLQTTVHLLGKYSVNLLEVERKVQGTSALSVQTTTTHKEVSTGSPPALAGLSGRVQSVLERKGQVILYGPPGTGKTYWAERAALDLAAFGAFGRPYAELVTHERATVSDESSNGLVRICTFHPGYGYEDFIEGYRPEAANNTLSFRLRDGVFKRLCADASRAPGRRFYLIVDEINRGDIPRIFGELLTVLERDKRGKAVILPVSGQSLRVPPNVFLIGTMNTADRSISLLDAALRRRFGFVELMPDPLVLGAHSVEGVPLGAWLAALNRRVVAFVGRDARNLQVGHSYLLQGGRPLRDLATLKRVLRDDILPLLEEYCYEDFDALKNILGAGFVDSDGRRLRNDLFEDGHEEALVQALMTPDVPTSAEAVAAGAGPEREAEEDSGEDEGEQ
jgi:5-methylcytosine-specific restriction protein B